MIGIGRRSRALGRLRRARVVLYTTPRCHLCDEARSVLDELGISYTVVDASSDSARFERTPVVEVDGSEVADAAVPASGLARALLS